MIEVVKHQSHILFKRTCKINKWDCLKAVCFHRWSRFGPLIWSSFWSSWIYPISLLKPCAFVCWLHLGLLFAMSCRMSCFRFPFVLQQFNLALRNIEDDTQHSPSTSIPINMIQPWFLLPRRRQAWGSYDNKRRKNATCINTMTRCTHDTYLIMIFTSLYHLMTQSFRDKHTLEEGDQTMMLCDRWPASPKASKRFIPV